MRVLYDDLLEDGTITSTHLTYPGHPIENIQDSRLSRNAWLAVELDSGDSYGSGLYGEEPYLNLTSAVDIDIDFDLGSTRDFDTFGMAGNNLVLGDLTLSWAVTDIETPDGSVTYNVTEKEWTIMVPLEAQSARYFRISIGSFTIEGNFLMIGRVSLGDIYPVPDIGPVYDVDHITTANRTFSDTRQLYGGPRVLYRRISVSYPDMETQEVLSTLFRDVDLYNPFFLEFDEECLDTEANMYSTFDKDTLPFNYNQARIYTARLTFTEVF